MLNVFNQWISGTEDRYYAHPTQSSVQMGQTMNWYGSLMIKAREFNETTAEPMNYFFEGVYPISVTGPAFSAADVGNVIEVTVTFAFYRMFQINVKRVLFCCCYLKKACPGYCDFHMTISTLFLFFLFFSL